jgi:thymidylate synthase
MHIGTFDNFTECYLKLIDTTYNDYTYESAPRGQKIKEILGATFTITNPRKRLPYVVGRKFGLAYLAAELVWYLSGNNKTEWISKYSNFWSTISDDGVTANSAYGARLFKKHNRIANSRFVQWDYILEELRRDPDSRRAVMHLRTPDDSIDASLDVPCTLALQFMIRDNKLHQIVHMRSSDVIFGIAYDVPAFTLFQEILATELGCDLGTYTHVSNSLHIYERHFEMAEEILKPENVEESIGWAKQSAPMQPLLKGTTLEKINDGRITPIVELEATLESLQTADAVYSTWDDVNYFDFWSDISCILCARRLRALGERRKAKDFMNTHLHRAYNFYKIRKVKK